MRLHVGFVIAVTAVTTLTGCGGLLQDTEEVANAAGDVMSSFDEAGQGASFAYLPRLQRKDFTEPTLFQQLSNALIPSAHADACTLQTFSACSAGSRSKMFSSCSIGAATLDGTVTLTFSQMDCSVMNVGDYVTRNADFTLTGPRAATLTVSSDGGGQKVTKTTSGWAYTVLGMHRVAKDSKGNEVFNIDTKTLTDISVTGPKRAGRVMNGGQLQITHNLAHYTTVITPNNVTWDGTCNCAVSGSWSGTVTNEAGKSEDFNIEITGCGKATVTTQKQTKNVTFDRCGGL